MTFNYIYDINTPTNYEIDESPYEVLEKSFDKNDVDINFFEKKNIQMCGYENEISQDELYCVKSIDPKD